MRTFIGPVLKNYTQSNVSKRNVCDGTGWKDEIGCAVFIDWCGLYQDFRTGDQKESFARALKAGLSLALGWLGRF